MSQATLKWFWVSVDTRFIDEIIGDVRVSRLTFPLEHDPRPLTQRAGVERLRQRLAWDRGNVCSTGRMEAMNPHVNMWINNTDWWEDVSVIFAGVLAALTAVSFPTAAWGRVLGGSVLDCATHPRRPNPRPRIPMIHRLFLKV